MPGPHLKNDTACATVLTSSSLERILVGEADENVEDNDMSLVSGLRREKTILRMMFSRKDRQT
jgi:hypothetical protein